MILPLPALATVTMEVDPNSSGDLYFDNASYLIHIGKAGDDVQAQVWSDGSWSDAETLFVDEDGDFNFKGNSLAVELTDGTIVLIEDGDGIISYSETEGFQYFSDTNGTVSDAIVNNNSVTLINCDGNGDEDDSTAFASTWTETDGVQEAVELPSSVCTDDLSYFAGKKNAVVDYYSGNVYDPSNSFATLASIDLSTLGYVDANDDWDAQGNNPDYAKKKNGDIAFAFQDNLYGYAYNDQTWRTLITLDDGFTVVGDDSQGDDDYSPLETENGKQLFAFAANEDETEYQIYRWTSADGWQLEKTYSFSESTELVRTSIDYSKSTLNWGFWLQDSSELSVYQWSESNGYEKIAEQTMDCTNCNLTLDVSKKGKVYVAAVSATGDSTTTLEAWKPGTDTWQSTTLPAGVSGNYLSTHVSADGRWIVVYQMNDSSYSAVRWTPDGGWGSRANLNAESVSFNDDLLYFVTLDPTDSLIVSRYKWSSKTSETLTSIEDVTSFNDDDTIFTYDDYLFVFYHGPAEAVQL